MELERVLTKLKFDDSVNGYALITNDGQPFLSFSLPDEVLPQIKGTLKIHREGLKLVNIMTGEGIVVLAKVDAKWVLAVLFSSELQLGTALSRTKDVVDLLKQVTLPPPPIPIEEDELVEEISMDDASIIEESTTIAEIEPEIEVTQEPDIPKVVRVFHGCVVHRGSRYTEAMTLDSVLNSEMKKAYSNLGVDILLIADEKMTIYKIADRLAKPVERVLEAVKWCVREGIVDVECPDEQEPSQKEIVELPLYEGKIDKAKKDHRSILELCDGKRTLQEIANELGIPYFQALQSVLPYRGKTLRFIRTDKLSRG
ncbi:hypothetical protein EU527_01855 [Candidatus Thorarchaeota archaeon]|nr:MAG: hypothetical protein EU527_01855 [Candidatus Thorarchaeota archaeon]